MDRRIKTVADRLWDAAASGAPIAPVRDEITQAATDGDVLGVAYAVQQLTVQRRLVSGGRLVGRKIGLTSKDVQRQLGVDSPDFGALFADMAAADGEEIAWSRLMQPKAEAEIALVLERDLRHEKHTVADVISATAYVLPAIEVVASRIANWDIRLADTVADNASSGLFVLGTRPVPLRKIDLPDCGMVLERHGETVSVGSGAACLGNPLTAAIWLADVLLRMGTPLAAGDVVLTGALGPMVDVEPGDAFTARIEGLGAVRAIFGRPATDAATARAAGHASSASSVLSSSTPR
ncbi:MAG: fumarylacetoacetate hydrolase family protein [Burkholderiales bacterium]|nr:fumarylacetoacetate hydrolase family protein [Burkholderiales bacterium]